MAITIIEEKLLSMFSLSKRTIVGKYDMTPEKVIDDFVVYFDKLYNPYSSNYRSAEHVFVNGGCYVLAKMLNLIFTKSELAIHVIVNQNHAFEERYISHCGTLINGTFYDINKGHSPTRIINAHCYYTRSSEMRFSKPNDFAYYERATADDILYMKREFGTGVQDNNKIIRIANQFSKERKATLI